MMTGMITNHQSRACSCSSRETGLCFQAWMLGFTSFHGTWETELLAENEILVRYSYQLIAKHWFLFPLQWLFANWFWKRYMNQVMRNIIQLIKTHEPYQYD